MDIKIPDHDDDGNDLVLDPKSDVGQLIYLLEYARQRKFQIGPTVQIGSVIVQVRDLRLFGEKGEPESDIWKENGHEEKP